MTDVNDKAGDDFSLSRKFEGLALSGGGYRASFFHIGVLARLAELDLLRHIRILSTVSGGSIVGPLYHLKLGKTLREGKEELDDYLGMIRELRQKFLEGAQRDLRSRTFGHIRSNSSSSNSERIGVLYEKHFYSEFKPKSRRIKMSDLYQGEPTIYLNATVLETGQRWVFTPQYMGAWEDRASRGLFGSTLARRYPYSKLGDGLDAFPLGRAVAASSCFPIIFPPLSLPLGPFHFFDSDQSARSSEDLPISREGEPGELERRLHDMNRKLTRERREHRNLLRDVRFHLVDGGVVDNLGLGPFPSDVQVLVSNASAPPEPQRPSRASLIGTAVRSFQILSERTQQAANLQALSELKDHATRREVSLARFIQENRPEPFDLSRLGSRTEMLDMLSRVRTDLDAFTDWEADALMFAGYQSACESLQEYAVAKKVEWPFEWIGKIMEEGNSSANVRKHLGESDSHFKMVRLMPWFFRVRTLVVTVILFVILLVLISKSELGLLGGTVLVLVGAVNVVVAGFLLMRVLTSLGMAVGSWCSLLLSYPLLRRSRGPRDRRADRA